MTAFAKAFCLTKVGDYSGQSPDLIVRRKELERLAGNGNFWWGVGESKGSAIAHLRSRESKPQILFVPQRKCRKARGGERLLFESYMTEDGRERALPKHVIMTRGRNKSGNYYAVACRSHQPLQRPSIGTIHIEQYRNLGKDGNHGRKPGNSQNTLVLIWVGGSKTEDSYEVLFDAEVVAWHPLGPGRALSSPEVDMLDDVSECGDVDDWRRCVKVLRRR